MPNTRVLLAGEQRRLAGVGGGGGVPIQRIGHLRQNKSLVGIEGSAQCHIQQAVLRAGAGHKKSVIFATDNYFIKRLKQI